MTRTPNQAGSYPIPPFNRIEWRLARGYHAWFMTEIEENRVLWPRLGVPASGVGAQ